MARTALMAALLTGAFCAVFALAVGALGTLLSVVPVVAVSFVSGFLGSLFASLVTRRR